MLTKQVEEQRNIIKEALQVLRQVVSNSDVDVVSIDELQSIQELYNMLGYYNSSSPRVFLIGEFKAGKSSLVNAILGVDYAPTDIFEMTGWVSKFWRSEEDYCKIIFKDGKEEVLDRDQFISKCEKRSIPKQELQKIRTVEFGINNLETNYIIIDTPGFGSINSDNEKKMLELVYEADIILFIVDAESIGSVKEAAIIKEHIEKEIPYLIIISKADLVDSKDELNEIKQYVVDIYQADENKIFAVSTINPDSPFEVNNLKTYLTEYSQNFDSEKRQKAEIGYLNIISERLYNLYSDVEFLLDDIQNKVNSFNSYIDSLTDTISKSLILDLEKYGCETILKNKRKEITEEITNELTKSKGTISAETLQSIFNTHLGSDFIAFTYKQMMTELPIRMKQKWESYLDEIKDKSFQVFSKVRDNGANSQLEYFELSKIGNYDIELDQITSKTFGRGIKGSLGFAGVLTAYAAWFGPGAAAVSLPMALTGVGLPIMVVGAGIAGLLAYKKRNQANDQMDIMAADILDNFVKKIVAVQIMPELSKQFIIYNKQFSNEIKSKFFNENRLGIDEEISFERIRIIKENLKGEKKKIIY